MVAPAVERTYVRDLGKCLGQRVALCGWFNGPHRPDGQVLVVRDRTGTVPVVYRGSVRALSRESAIRVLGTVRTGASARFGAIEVDADQIEVLTRAEPPCGAPPAHVALRNPDRLVAFEVQTTVESALREVLLARGFVEIHTPGPDPGRLQLAMAAGLDRAFEVAAAADGHARLDVELSWITGVEDLLGLAEELLRRVLFAVRELHGAQLQRQHAVAVEMPDGPLPRIGADRAAGVRDVSAYARERGHGYLLVTDGPGFVLFGHGHQLAAGSVREPDELSRYGCPPHGGFGLDVSRLLAALLHRPSTADTALAR